MSQINCPPDCVICPYNKSHVIRLEKIQFHLAKCEQGQKDKPSYSVCPFNSTHLIPSSDINSHKSACPDRIKFDTFVHEQATSAPLFPVQNIHVKSTENWDDFDCPTYDPETALKDKKVLQLKQVVPPSERKRFHAEQRKKFQSLQDSNVTKIENKTRTPRLPMFKPTNEEVPRQVPSNIECNKKIEPKTDKSKIDENENEFRDDFQVVCNKKNKKGQVNQIPVHQPSTDKNNVKTQMKQFRNKENIGETKKEGEGSDSSSDQNFPTVAEVPVKKDDAFQVVSHKKKRSTQRK